MGLETAVSQKGKEKSVSASCGQVSLKPSGNVQVVVKQTVDYFNSSGCRGIEGRRIFPSEDLKINASPPLPLLLSWKTSCKPAVLRLEITDVGFVAGKLNSE